MNTIAPSSIDAFIAHLRNERRLSPHTQASYRRDLSALTAYCDEAGIDDWAAVGGFDLQQFAGSLHRRGTAPRSIARTLSAIRTFFDYLVREDVLEHNPGADVRAPRHNKRLPGTVDVDRMSALLDIRDDTPLALRDCAIMELFYSSGLRLAELVGLDLEGLDLDDRTVRVLGKGAKTRILPVGSKAVARLRAWLGVRGGFLRPDSDETQAVFLSNRGRRISPRSVQARIKYWAKRQGIDVNLYPHLFRHSFATHMLESSRDLRGVQEMLGHADIGTTQVYTHLDFQHLARTYDETHPRARKKNKD